MLLYFVVAVIFVLFLLFLLLFVLPFAVVVVVVYLKLLIKSYYFVLVAGQPKAPKYDLKVNGIPGEHTTTSLISTIVTGLLFTALVITPFLVLCTNSPIYKILPRTAHDPIRQNPIPQPVQDEDP